MLLNVFSVVKAGIILLIPSVSHSLFVFREGQFADFDVFLKKELENPRSNSRWSTKQCISQK